MPGGKKRSYVVKGILTDILKTKSSQKYCSCYEACQLYRAHTDRVTWKKLTIDDKYRNKRLFIHQTMFVSDIKKKKLLWRQWRSHLCTMAISQNLFKNKIKSCRKVLLTMHEKSRIFQHQYQRQVKIYIYLYQWSIYFGVCICIQCFYDVVKNKLQNINIY